MKKKEAMRLTREKFTNLYGGGILPYTTVTEILKYYDALLKEKNPVSRQDLLNQLVKPDISNIERRFMEKRIQEIGDLEDLDNH